MTFLHNFLAFWIAGFVYGIDAHALEFWAGGYIPWDLRLLPNCGYGIFGSSSTLSLVCRLFDQPKVLNMVLHL